MNMNHDSNGAHDITYKIIGTVSPSSLGTGSEAPSEHLLTLWAEYLAEQLQSRLHGVKDVQIRTAPFGGTRLAPVSNEVLHANDELAVLSEDILTEFCFNLDKIALHGMEDGYPKPGEEEC
jgi:hypothetical protein